MGGKGAGGGSFEDGNCHLSKNIIRQQGQERDDRKVERCLAPGQAPAQQVSGNKCGGFAEVPEGRMTFGDGGASGGEIAKINRNSQAELGPGLPKSHHDNSHLRRTYRLMEGFELSTRGCGCAWLRANIQNSWLKCKCRTSNCQLNHGNERFVRCLVGSRHYLRSR